MAGRCGCQSGCTCCSTSSPSIQVGGSGGAGQCFTPSVRYSADAGNSARAGEDGGVFADLCVLDSAGTRLTLDGQACVQIPPAAIRTYGGGDIIEPNPDGTVSLPTGGPPADFGAGLTVDGLGALMVDASGEWPLTDLLGNFLGGGEFEGSQIYLDASGQLRGSPEHTALRASTSSTLLTPTLLSVPGVYTSPSTDPVVIANPSVARQMQILQVAVAQIDLVIPNDGGALGVLDLRVNGGSWDSYYEVRWPESLSVGEIIRSQLALPISRATTANPLDVTTVEARVRVIKTGPGVSPTLVSVSARVLLLGVTV